MMRSPSIQSFSPIKLAKKSLIGLNFSSELMFWKMNQYIYLSWLNLMNKSFTICKHNNQNLIYGKNFRVKKTLLIIMNSQVLDSL